MTQGQMFPMTTLDVLMELAEIHRAEYNKAVNALAALSDDEKIARAYEKAEERVAKNRRLVEEIEASAARERERLTTTDPARTVAQVATVAGEIVDVVNSGAMDSEGITVTATLGAVDPITGEVAYPAVERYHSICPDCGGDGRIDDRTGGGRHRCKACVGSGKISRERPVPPHVLVAWPDTPDMQTITVGPLTRYGELAADFLVSLSGDDPRREDSFLDYRIVDVDAGSERDPRAVIVAADYGLCFSVEEPIASEVAS